MNEFRQNEQVIGINDTIPSDEEILQYYFSIINPIQTKQLLIVGDFLNEILEYETIENAVSKETSEAMKGLLESVVAEGGGNRCYIEGYRIGGKTATSQKLPRSARKYISSFIGFAPADDPEVIAMCIIDEPEGIYYGGTIAAPVIKELYDNILPYLGIEKENIGTLQEE